MSGEFDPTLAFVTLNRHAVRSVVIGGLAGECSLVIVDDHLAFLSVAGALPALGVSGPVITTYSFQYRMARAVSDSARAGSLSRRLPDPPAALRRVLHPPPIVWSCSTPAPASRTRYALPSVTVRTFYSPNLPAPPYTIGPRSA